MHEVLVNRLGGLSQHRKSVVRLPDRPDMTLAGNSGRKTTKQQQQQEREHLSEIEQTLLGRWTKAFNIDESKFYYSNIL